MVNVERVRLAYNNVYLVSEDDALVVIDTGPDYRGARETLLAALGGRSVTGMIGTHGHLDHAGLGAYWQRHGVVVSLGAADVALADGSDFEIEAMAEYVRSAGAPPGVEAEALDGLRTRAEWNRQLRRSQSWTDAPSGRWPTNLHYEPFTPACLLSGESDLPLGLRTISSPGHTPGNLVVYHEGEGWLFSGDQLLPDITPTPAIQFQRAKGGGLERFASLPRFLDSLQALEPLSLTRCFPGHGEPFDDVQAAIAANLEQARQRTERLAEALRDGPGTVYELAERMYPRALRRRFWQIISTVQGHLDVLAEAGGAEFEEGRWR